MLNQIDPSAQIHPSAVIGQGNYIGPGCMIGPNVTIGNFNRLEAYACIGLPAEHRVAMHGEVDCGVIIGDSCVIREFTTIHSGIERPTSVEDNVYMLRGSHVGHDAVIERKVNLSCNVLVGGHAYVQEGANVGLGAAIHQYRVVGAYAMVGMLAAVVKDVAPFLTVAGVPAKLLGLNEVGIRRLGEDPSAFAEYLNGTGLLPSDLRHLFDRWKALRKD